jgi:D-glycero-D-manno-heptose 1,7-bisphosphate phosphatase
MKRKAIFLDRDGTISREVGYLTDLNRLELLPGSAAAISAINRSGMLAILATNQSGVARGLFPEQAVRNAHMRLGRMLSKQGTWLDALYYCPHHPLEGRPPYRLRCLCRKPRPGMLLRAATEHRLDLANCYMVGDSRKDIALAHAVGATPVLVLTGYGQGAWHRQRHRFRRDPACIAADLAGAVQWILERERSLHA